jgi:uncharacterized phage protein (TIGR01671 family)
MIDDHTGWVEDIGINEALRCSAEYGYVAMQFTGLQDKYGKDIYEGDIVDSGGYIVSLFIVYFRDGGFWYKFQDESVDIPFAGHAHLENFHDIGNIYEHPQLLNPNTQKQ